ncbi:MAG TPA: Ig-like domain-containing protein, partial [Candidatus Sericytochromatia bacterium]
MERRSNKADKYKFLQPVDRAAIALMLVLIVLIGLLIWNGDRTAPRVRNFSWQNQQVGAEDTSFTLNFNRPMDHASVEANLQIDPLIPGKFSWAGRRMAYTLTAPVFYGTNYKVQLQGAKDKSKTESGQEKEKLIDPFYGQFSTRDRAFVYIGVEPQEKGRLILYNVTQQKKTVLTPADMAVNDFKIYPQGTKILFSAADWLSQKPGVFEQQLYTVTTGINPVSPAKPETKPEAAGKINLVLDSKNFQNMKFDLSPDGQAIIVQRVNRNKPGEFGLWVIRPNAPPQPLENQPGGD